MLKVHLFFTGRHWETKLMTLQTDGILDWITKESNFHPKYYGNSDNVELNRPDIKASHNSVKNFRLKRESL